MLRVFVKDLMRKDPVVISADYTLKEAAQEMEAINCGVLPVGTRDALEGIITDRDIVLRAVAKGRDVNKEKVGNYMTPEVCFVNEDDTYDYAVRLMRAKNINRILVKNRSGKPSGILTAGRIIRENDSLQEISASIAYAVG